MASGLQKREQMDQTESQGVERLLELKYFYENLRKQKYGASSNFQKYYFSEDDYMIIMQKLPQDKLSDIQEDIEQLKKEVWVLNDNCTSGTAFKKQIGFRREQLRNTSYNKIEGREPRKSRSFRIPDFVKKIKESQQKQSR
jgi:hypothetical protein